MEPDRELSYNSNLVSLVSNFDIQSNGRGTVSNATKEELSRWKTISETYTNLCRNGSTQIQFHKICIKERRHFTNRSGEGSSETIVEKSENFHACQQFKILWKPSS